MSNITKIRGRQILDSRGNPTVEVDVFCGDIMGRALPIISPQKTSTSTVGLPLESKICLPLIFVILLTT